MYGLRLIAGPVGPRPLDLAMVKKHLRVRHGEEDSYIEQLALAAMESAELATRRQLLTATWELVLDCFPGDGEPIRLPLGNVQEVVAIAYTNANGDDATWDSAAYMVADDREPAEIWPVVGENWPSPRAEAGAVRVQYMCGYGATDESIPVLLRHGLLLVVGHWYMNREAVVTGTIATELPISARHIFEQFSLGDDFHNYAIER